MDENLKHHMTFGEFLRNRSGYIEMFAAAYLKQTGLDPTKAKMIEKHETTETGMIVTYWFEENTGVLTRIEQLEAELGEWKAVAEKLTANYTYYDDEGNILCAHCCQAENYSGAISHLDYCPITIYHKLKEKYSVEGSLY